MKEMNKYALLSLRDLCCSYDKPFVEGQSRVVLEVRQLDIMRGETMFIVGESGIGKSTVLETLGMMNNTIVPDNSSSFTFHDSDGNDIDLVALWHQSDDSLSRLRRNHFSFIFQSTNLMPNFTAYENVAFTRLLQGYSRSEAFKRTHEVLSDLGLEHIDETRMAQELSGGQQQRLAFARAILPDFTVLFGDEPTGNLDPENAMRVMQIISKKIGERKEASAVIVSHDMRLAINFANVIVKIRKELRPKKQANDEDVMYGVIDTDCVWRPTSDRTSWCNRSETMSASDFEVFLRK